MTLFYQISRLDKVGMYGVHASAVWQPKGWTQYSKLNYIEEKMNISNVFTKFCITFFAGMILLLTVGGAQAQTDTAKKVRLNNPATVKGEIGGESHDSYVIHVRKNQTLKVQIDWKEKGDRTAQFVVSRSADFFAGDVIRGILTYNEKNWYSKIKKTGDYYIYVTGHPVANYTLKVSVK